MADWQTVRYDPTYIEPLDAELIPLLDALNGAGFVTDSSCSGHGTRPPAIWFAHIDDKRIERLARFVMASENFDFHPHSSQWQKEILVAPGASRWNLHIRLNGCSRDTTEEEMMVRAVNAINLTAARVKEFAG